MIIIMNKICALLFFASILDAHALVCMEINKRQPRTSYGFAPERIDENFAQLSSKNGKQLAAVRNKIHTTRDEARIQELYEDLWQLRLKEVVIKTIQSDFNKAIKREPTVGRAVDDTLHQFDLVAELDPEDVIHNNPELVQEIKNCLNVHAPLPGSSSK